MNAACLYVRNFKMIWATTFLVSNLKLAMCVLRWLNNKKAPGPDMYACVYVCVCVCVWMCLYVPKRSFDEDGLRREEKLVSGRVRPCLSLIPF